MILHGYALPSHDDYPHARSPINTNHSNSNDALTSSTSSSMSLFKSPNSPHPPLSPSYSDDIHTDSAEDALIEEQLQHLQKNNNLYLNGSNNTNTTKMSPLEFFNGNISVAETSSTTTRPAATTNGHNHHISLQSSSALNGNPQR